jgi:hypothetical protein
MLLLSKVFSFDINTNTLVEKSTLSIDKVSTLTRMSSVSLQTYFAILEELLNEREGESIKIHINQQTFMNRLQGSVKTEPSSIKRDNADITPQDRRFGVIKTLIDNTNTNINVDNQVDGEVRNPNEFNTTLFDISRSTGNDIELLIKQLYSLQCDGIIQYQLSEPPIMIDILQYCESNIPRIGHTFD